MIDNWLSISQTDISIKLFKLVEAVEALASHYFFLAVQDSSITDIVGRLVCRSQLTIRAYGASKSDPRH